ncbi:MAG: hypothetical protein IJ444_01940 [Kiritimatiellae bacterium]|nr:hypothetical protein [Kiritimatiellia bacterium]
MPQSDTSLSKSGSFADAAAVGTKVRGLEADIQEVSTSVTETSSKVDQLSESLENLGADVEGKGYVTEAQLQEKGYVTEESLVESDYVTTTALAELGYVTDTELDEKAYITVNDIPVATVDSYNATATIGIVKPYPYNFDIDSSGYLVPRMTLNGLSDVIVTSTTPASPIDGFWYIMPWAGDG